MVLQVAELQQNYSDWLSQQAGEQDAAHEMQRSLREAQGDSQALRHKLSAAQQQHSRAEAKYHSKVGRSLHEWLYQGGPPWGHMLVVGLMHCGLQAKQAWLLRRGSAALKVVSICKHCWQHWQTRGVDERWGGMGGYISSRAADDSIPAATPFSGTVRAAALHVAAPQVSKNPIRTLPERNL